MSFSGLATTSTYRWKVTSGGMSCSGTEMMLRWMEMEVITIHAIGRHGEQPARGAPKKYWTHGKTRLRIIDSPASRRFMLRTYSTVKISTMMAIR